MTTDYSSIWAKILQLLRFSWPAVVLYVGLSLAPFTYLDLYNPESDFGYWIVSVVLYGADLLLLITVMRSAGYLNTSVERRVWPYFVTYILTGILIAIAALALVLPGIYLAMRWLPLFAHLLSSDDDPWAAMGWSIDQTEKIQRPLLLAMIGPLTCYLISFAAILHWNYVYLEHDAVWPIYEWVSSVWTNLFQAMGFVWFTLLGVASFQIVTDGENDRQEKIEKPA